MSGNNRIGSPLSDESVILEPCDEQNVDLLVKWSLDPIAQGPYKRVPTMNRKDMRKLFLNSPDRWYFLVKDRSNGRPLGRFYYRAWHFHENSHKIDWELNIFIANPVDRGKGYGSTAQKLATNFLLNLPQTHSVFAYTFTTNIPEQRALEKIGFENKGLLPSPYFRVKLPPHDCLLFVLK
ncbi:MAG: GNAT family N-acetyltransferase [Candidatus Thorarchaeota archaeon]